METSSDSEPITNEPIRGSIVVLALKLLVALLLFDLLYSGLYIGANIIFQLPFDWHHHVSIILIFLQFVKILTQVYLVLFLVITWASSSYLLTKNHVIRLSGLMSTKEDVFHFDNIRSISVTQSLFGKHFNYGDITLKTSASGGYQGDIVLSGIHNPEKYKKLLEQRF
jgi:uncharacterized membrane protein YdbT with pleckstrin-like domain